MKKELKKFFSLNNISLVEKACINYSNKLMVCENCIEACPTNAIELVNRLPKINHSACINCGSCVSSCSALALDHEQKPYMGVVDQIKKHPTAFITCDYYENYQKGIKVPCYLLLDLPILLQYEDHKNELTFYVGACDKCQKSSLGIIKKHFEDLQKELVGIGSSLIIKLMTAELNKEKDRTINGLTRRELFQSLSIKKIRDSFFEKGADEKEVDYSKKVAYRDRVLYKRKVINDFLENNASSLNDRLLDKHFYTIDMVNHCNGCNICEQICLTDAIRWQKNGTESSLVFSSKQCIGCQRCIACPEQSLKLKEISVQQYQNEETKVLTSLKNKECPTCGEFFRTSLEEDLCPICLGQKGKDPKRFFN